MGFSPVRHVPRLFFQIHSQNIRAEQVVGFLTELHRQLRRKILVILDRYSAHRKAVRLLQEQHPDWIEVVWLPAYAPELNPVEMVWNHTKYGDLANYIPADMEEWRQTVCTSLERTGSEATLLMSCFRRTGLEW
jgi:transposase